MRSLRGYTLLKWQSYRTWISGARAFADAAYLKESIINSGAKVLYGYAPAMPGYTATFSDAELDQLVEYIKTLR